MFKPTVGETVLIGKPASLFTTVVFPAPSSPANNTDISLKK